LPKEEHAGKTIADYKAVLATAGHTHESIDISVALGAVMAIKDDEELVSKIQPLYFIYLNGLAENHAYHL